MDCYLISDENKINYNSVRNILKMYDKAGTIFKLLPKKISKKNLYNGLRKRAPLRQYRTKTNIKLYVEPNYYENYGQGHS